MREGYYIRVSMSAWHTGIFLTYAYLIDANGMKNMRLDGCFMVLNTKY
jgi:hypothetical protein